MKVRIMDKLLPCPFCGGYADIESHHEHAHYVRCINECIPSTMYIYDENADNAVKRWNTRAETQAVRELTLALNNMVTHVQANFKDHDSCWVREAQQALATYGAKEPTGE